MKNQVESILEYGSEAIVIDIECALSNALPGITIVGLGNKSIDEAKERIRNAFNASKIKPPRKKITINLSPSDIPKEGSGFDLPMAVAILQASEMIKNRIPNKTLIMGELGLDGSIKPIRGVIGKIIAGKRLGYKNFIIPPANSKQAEIIPNINLYCPDNLSGIFRQLNDIHPINFKPTKENLNISIADYENNDIQFNDVVGQEQAKRALLISASGHHNIMLSGPPGTGKSMLAKAYINILPPLNNNEILEVTHIHSLVSKNYDGIITKRPLRTPHHSSSQISIVGGGSSPKPGEISLSHNGVLFLDELPEFNKQVIEALRQPLEDRKITVARAKDSAIFPAKFILIATSNPCPCGYFGSKKECSCLPHNIIRYQNKVSGPIVDRFDLYVGVDEVEHSKLLQKNSVKDSNLNNIVNNARTIQINRAGKLNNELSNKEIKKYCQLDKESKEFFDRAAEKLLLSARSYMKILKVSRTIADLEKSDQITLAHVSEAMQYRKKDIEI